MKLIELDALVAEVNKRIMDAPINNIGHQRVWAYNDVKDIINTLEVKEVQDEPVSEDLENEIQRYYVDWDEHPQYVQTARHFAKWQKEQMMKDGR